MMKLIYIGLIIIISIWTIYLYIDKDQDYRNELNDLRRMLHDIPREDTRARQDFIEHMVPPHLRRFF